MKKKIGTPLGLFLGLSTVLAILFFVVPLPIFDGKIVFESEWQSFEAEAPLSLSYFIGIGVSEGDMDGVKDFYLTGKGMFMACIFIMGFPALLAYRRYLKSADE